MHDSFVGCGKFFVVRNDQFQSLTHFLNFIVGLRQKESFRINFDRPIRKIFPFHPQTVFNP